MASTQPLVTTSNILPPNPSFAGHGTFAIRSGWLKKGLDALHADSREGSIFNQPDALVTLGVGKNMVGAIRYWLLATRMAREEGAPGNRRLHSTPLGDAIFADAPQGWDPFLEDEATLWLLHWQLAGPHSGAFTWAYAFNLFREWEFSKETLVEAVVGAVQGRVAKPVSRDSIERDVQCLLQTYVADERGVMSEDLLDCPLRQLGLLRTSHNRHFRFAIGAKPTLPPLVFFYALAKFWMWKHHDARTLSVWELTYAEGSPGLVFKLDEDSVLGYLDALADATQGRLLFEDTAQVRQVVLAGQETVNPQEFLERFYGRPSNVGSHSKRGEAIS